MTALHSENYSELTTATLTVILGPMAQGYSKAEISTMLGVRMSFVELLVERARCEILEAAPELTASLR